MSLKVSNDILPIIKPGWAGNKLNEKGRYTNIHGDDIKSIKDIWQWMRSPKPFKKLKKEQQSPLSWKRIENLFDKTQNAIIPIGHASFIIDTSGIRLLIDPVIVPNRLIKRYTDIPFKVPELNNVNYILLSHNHRDHIDKNSIIQVCRYNPEAIILTGLEIGKLLKNWGIKNNIQEAGWYQRYKTTEALDIDYLPSHHWSRRWFTDTNLSLWGSFMIQDKKTGKNLYYAGDSAYQPHFLEIGNDYQIDIAMIGVGAYEPKWFMSSAHTGPKDAIRAFKDLKAQKWIPMHYGTFDLSDEPIFYPEKILKEQHSEALNHIIWVQIGYRIYF